MGSNDQAGGANEVFVHSCQLITTARKIAGLASGRVGVRPERHQVLIGTRKKA